MQRKKKSLLFVAALVLLLAVSFKSLEVLLLKGLSGISDNLKVGSVSLSPVSLKLRSFVFSLPPARFTSAEVTFRPLFTRRAFAFSAPSGRASFKESSREVSIRGSVSGNLREGVLDIKEAVIEAEELGTFELQGVLREWGKEKITGTVRFRGTDIQALNSFLDMNIPLRGNARGLVTVDYAGLGEGRIDFDLEIDELRSEETEAFHAVIKGNHDISGSITTISSGQLTAGGDRKILFAGHLDGEDFSLEFQTEGMLLEELLKLLPPEIIDRYNIRTHEGIVSLEDFRVEKIKKKYS